MNSLFYSPFDPFGATSYRRAQPAPRRRDLFSGHYIPDDYYYQPPRQHSQYYDDDEDPYYDPRHSQGYQSPFFNEATPFQRHHVAPRQSPPHPRHNHARPQQARGGSNVHNSPSKLPSVPQQKVVHIPINRISRSPPPTPTPTPQQVLDKVKASIAARTIQQSFRRHRQQKRNLAAIVIQRALKTQMIKNSVQPIVQGLRELQSIKNTLSQTIDEYANVWTTPLIFNSSGDMIRGLENKTFLGLEDALVKLLIRLDALQINGDLILREHRRSVVKKVEETLSKLDAYKEQEHNRWMSERASAKKNDVDVDWEQLEMDFDADVWSCNNTEGLESVFWPCTVQCS